MRLVELFFLVLALARATFTQRQHTTRWHLLRVRQRGPLSALRSHPAPFPSGGAPVNIYVVDSGLRLTHNDFDGRAENGIDFIGNDGEDCQGHGTSVGSLAAGKFSGVAREARLISVRVLDCNGVGHCSNVVRALKWIRQDAPKRRPARAVVVMSLGSNNERCEPTISLTRALARDGILVLAASGNAKNDSCDVYPARSDATITVSATDKYDRLYKNNNMGSCVDLLAPGVRVVAAWGNVSDTDYRYVSGTSHATPLVAGAAALILAADSTLSTLQLRDIVVGSATLNRIFSERGEPLPTGQVNRLLFVPWARLFDEIPRDAKETRSLPLLVGNRSTAHGTTDSWDLIKVDFLPRVIPAMQYSALMIRKAIGKVGAFDSDDLVVRRAYDVKRTRNGTEPSTIRLNFYVRREKRDIKLIHEDIKSGKLQKLSNENVRLLPDASDNYLHRGVELPEGIDDKCKESPFVRLDAPSIILSAILTWMIFMVVVAVLSTAWKRKFLTVKRNNRTDSYQENSENVADP